MLSALRNLARTWVAKALFVLLILSFAIWGIEDIVRNFGRDTAVARVAGESIEVETAQNAVRREMLQLQRRLGPNFEPDENIRRAVAAQALEQLIAERTLHAEAERMGVAVPEEAVRDYVFSIPSFQVGGQFSRAMLDNFLRQSDLSEPQFLAIVASDIRRMQLAGAVRAGAAAPAPLAQRLLAWEEERRVADVAEFPIVEAPEPEPPTEAQLRRFHENNPDMFSAPEMREAIVAVLSAEALADGIEVPEEEIEAAYDQRRDQFETPERRGVEQALVPSREAAEAIATAWRDGADLDTIEAEATQAGGTALSLGLVDRGGLPVSELADAAFSTPEGGVTDPVQSPFGWHVLRVTEIAPGSTRPLAEVRDELRHEIARDRAADVAYERANRVEDALAGGATLQEAAAESGMAVATVRTSANGTAPDGTPVDLAVPASARAETLQAIFAAEPGRVPRLHETRDGAAFVAVELREVTPRQIRPFEEVEAEVRQAYAADARRRHQEEQAAALLAAVQGGRPLPEAAREMGAQVDRFGPFPRRPEQDAAPGATVPPELIAPLFEARPGAVTMVPTRRGYAVGQLVEVVPADTSADQAALERLRAETAQDMADDLEAQYAAAMRERADVRINPTLLEQIAR